MRTTILTVATALLLMPVLSAQAKKGGGGGATVEKSFQVGATCTISTPDKATAALADLKTNDKVTVAYHEDGDKMVADSVTVMPATKGEKPAKGDQPKGAKPKGEKVKGGGTHVRGMITSVDAQTGTIKVSVHERKPKPAAE